MFVWKGRGGISTQPVSKFCQKSKIILYLYRSAHVDYYRCMWHYKKGNRPPERFGGFSFVPCLNHSLSSVCSINRRMPSTQSIFRYNGEILNDLRDKLGK